MRVVVHFYSYFKDLAGCNELTLTLRPGSTITDLLDHLSARLPRLAEMRRSTLTAVGVEYQKPDYVLHSGDEISLFPPVQGG